MVTLTQTPGGFRVHIISFAIRNMSDVTSTSRGRSRVQMSRVSAEDFAIAQAALQKVSFAVVPDGQSQRQVFAQLMPNIFVLRRKGCSFQQISGLLAQCKINLQPSTVSRYYAEMLAERMDICEQQMQTQIAVLAELKKQTKGVDISAIVGIVDETMARQSGKVDATVASLLGGRDLNKQPASTISGPVPNRKDRVPTPLAARTEQSLEKQTAKAPTNASARPVSTPPPRTGSGPGPSPKVVDPIRPRRYKCGSLKAGIAQLKPRAGVPPDVYKVGNIEHPAIPHLVLTLEQRLYGACLEVIDEEDGTIRLETMEEKRFRVVWRKPVPATPSRTQDDFTRMNLALFPKRTPVASQA